LVRETKDPDWPKGARTEEYSKVKCGDVHFRHALGVDYDVVSAASQLPRK